MVAKAESIFGSWDAYLNFEDSCKKSNRFFRSDEDKKFLNNLLKYSKHRSRELSMGDVYYRAQRGCDIDKVHIGGNPTSQILQYLPFANDKMLPDSRFTGDGRANPKRVAYLYVASKEKIAISEMRPWIKANITLAEMSLNRDILVADFTPKNKTIYPDIYFYLDRLEGENALTVKAGYDVDESMRDEIVASHIDNAFSKPINPDDYPVEYIPTQIVAEFLRKNGFDGIKYGSSFVNPKEGYNLVVFNINHASIIKSQVYQVDSIEMNYSRAKGLIDNDEK